MRSRLKAASTAPRKHNGTVPPGQIELRRASRADAADLRAWRNDPVTRRASFSSTEVSEGEHARWLDDRLGDPGCRLWIATLSGRPVGQVRIDGLERECAEVSIVVAPEHRGQGHAARILQAAARELAAEGLRRRLVARVKPDNTASLAAFARAGYVPQGMQDDAVVLRSRGARPSPK